MMHVSEFIRNRALVDEYSKMINSNAWTALMDVAKTSFMRPPNPRIQSLDAFKTIDPAHVAPMLHGISIGMWEMIEKLSNLHNVEDLSKLGEPVESFGSDDILAKEQQEREKATK